MKYISTRGASPAVSSAQAIVNGLAPDGGLYTFSPAELPKLDWQRLIALDYYHMAAEIISALLPDFTSEEMLGLVRRAYTGKFPSTEIAPTVAVGDMSVLELFRGPTSAFKDVALCLLPYLMKASAEKCGDVEKITILTATSGDTGKAALEGFRDVPGIDIAVFYPRDGVSPVQKAQMVTQEGRNVHVCAVDGNFDDAQSGVKQIFESVRDRGLSSANSINIGRLVPQVVYYFSAYADLVKQGRLTPARSSASPSPPATSVISSPASSPVSSVFPSAALSAPRMRTTSSPIFCAPAPMTAAAAFTAPSPRLWISSFPVTLSACCTL